MKDLKTQVGALFFRGRAPNPGEGNDFPRAPSIPDAGAVARDASAAWAILTETPPLSAKALILALALAVLTAWQLWIEPWLSPPGESPKAPVTQSAPAGPADRRGQEKGTGRAKEAGQPEKADAPPALAPAPALKTGESPTPPVFDAVPPPQAPATSGPEGLGQGPEGFLADKPRLLVARRELWPEDKILALARDPAREGLQVLDAALPGLKLQNKTLRGALFSNCDLSGMILEDMVFIGVTFRQTHLRRVRFKNTDFIDCVFEDTLLDEAGLEDILFQGGRMSQLKLGMDTRIPMRVRDSALNRVVFDGVDFDGVGLHEVSGSLTLKNIRRMIRDAGERAVINASNLALRLEDSFLGNKEFFMNFASITGNYQVYARNCVFSGSRSSLDGDGARQVIFMEDCRFERNAGLSANGTVLLRRCALGRYASLSGTGNSRWWLEGCSFPLEGNGHGSLHGGLGTHMYVTGPGLDGPKAYLDLSVKGRLFLSDIVLAAPVIEKMTMKELSLRRARLEGGKLEGLQLLGGRWEAVTLLPQIFIHHETRLSLVQTRDLRMPYGRPWENRLAGSDREAQEHAQALLPAESPAPLSWDDLTPPPTPEALGFKP